ncbi:LuxR C-terminal-related transcriptional regulator [Streptomyces sp. NPDC056387]|uniref:LuxR C-terminal-related transcriptional regulator n=1 Tax=Streptomyces sp. NPDC056387 TaxID=3345803 RepID=UPI0035D73CDC
MTAPARPVLTDRELYVLLRSAAGDTYAVIAKDLQMHELAVGKIASRMFVKLGARNMNNAVLLGCHAGFIDGRRQHHGDHNGYEAHVRRGDEICDDCRAGEKAYRAGLKAAKAVTA